MYMACEVSLTLDLILSNTTSTLEPLATPITAAMSAANIRITWLDPSKAPSPKTYPTLNHSISINATSGDNAIRI